jgi:hypothetical protein
MTDLGLSKYCSQLEIIKINTVLSLNEINKPNAQAGHLALSKFVRLFLKNFFFWLDFVLVLDVKSEFFTLQILSLAGLMK